MLVRGTAWGAFLEHTAIELNAKLIVFVPVEERKWMEASWAASSSGLTNSDVVIDPSETLYATENGLFRLAP
jgi:hypothetical protein